LVEASLSPINRHYALRDPPPDELTGIHAAKAYLKFPTTDGVNLCQNYMIIMEAVASKLEAGANPVVLARWMCPN
jgi:hypothetical protein